MTCFAENYFPLLGRFSRRANRWKRKRFDHDRSCRIIKGKPVSVVEYALPGELNPRKQCIAFLSDLHWHDNRKNREVVAHLEKIFSLYRPDILLLGGDMTGDAVDIAGLPEVLRRLRRFAGQCFAVGGNWEFGKRWLEADFWKKLFAPLDIIWLQNETVTVNGIQITGTADLSWGDLRLPENRGEADCRILLTHNPDAAVALDSGNALSGFDLVLCGHTHGGQVNYPLLNVPLRIHSHYGKFFAHGIYTHETYGLPMLVGAGVSELSFPLRFNCRREVLILK